MREKMRGRNSFQRYSCLLNILAKFYSLFPLRIRKRHLIRARFVKGMIGSGIRCAALKSISLKCGSNVSLYDNCYLIAPEKLCLRNNVSIHPMCYLDANGGIQSGIDQNDIVGISHSDQGVTMVLLDENEKLVFIHTIGWQDLRYVDLFPELEKDVDKEEYLKVSGMQFGIYTHLFFAGCKETSLRRGTVFAAFALIKIGFFGSMVQMDIISTREKQISCRWYA